MVFASNLTGHTFKHSKLHSYFMQTHRRPKCALYATFKSKIRVFSSPLTVEQNPWWRNAETGCKRFRVLRARVWKLYAVALGPMFKICVPWFARQLKGQKRHFPKSNGLRRGGVLSPSSNARQCKIPIGSREARWKPSEPLTIPVAQIPNKPHPSSRLAATSPRIESVPRVATGVVAQPYFEFREDGRVYSAWTVGKVNGPFSSSTCFVAAMNPVSTSGCPAHLWVELKVSKFLLWSGSHSMPSIVISWWNSLRAILYSQLWSGFEIVTGTSAVNSRWPLKSAVHF